MAIPSRDPCFVIAIAIDLVLVLVLLTVIEIGLEHRCAAVRFGCGSVTL